MQNENTIAKQGGMMRCCLETIYEYVHRDPHGRTEPGFVLYCAYEEGEHPTAMMLGGDGVWRWVPNT